MKNESREAEKLAEAMAHADWLGKNAPDHSETGMMASLAAEVRRLEALALRMKEALKYIANIENGPDKGSAQARCLVAVGTAEAILAIPAISALLSKAAKSQEGAP